MISGRDIQDALNLLPDDLLEPVDALRRKKRVPWKALTALAACLCLCVGLWHFFPGAAAENSAGGDLVGNADADGALKDEYTAESGSGVKISEVEVYEVGEDYLSVVPIPKLPEGFNPDDFCVQMATIRVTFEKLDTPPALEPGQKIRLYYTEYVQGSMAVTPYRIEIIED